MAFEGITDEQVKSLRVRTTGLRMDSTQIASDIRDASRLYLLVEGVRRLWRILDADEQGRYATLCEPYVKTEAEHYVYRIRGKSATDAAVAAIGLALAQMLGEVRERYAEHAVYQTVQRLFDDNYRLEAEGVATKANHEIGSGALAQKGLSGPIFPFIPHFGPLPALVRGAWRRLSVPGIIPCHLALRYLGRAGKPCFSCQCALLAAELH